MKKKQDTRIVRASAPGRLDVMGGIADYSGSLVLEMPIRERAVVRATARQDGLWRAYSQEAERTLLQPLVEVQTPDLSDISRARRFFPQNPKASWAAYVLGCVTLLLSEKKIPPCGANLFLQSGVPWAKGLSSSAAVEVAVMAVLGKLFSLKLGDTELPRLCQRVENEVVGAPCGLMDQLTCYLGKKGGLLPILCRPDQVLRPVPVPKGIHFVGVDSGIRHWVGGASYSDVRAAAFMGYSLIALREGATLSSLRRAQETGDASRLPFNGYLAAVTPSQFESRFARILPEKMRGRNFLGKAVSIDQSTQVKAGTDYRVLACSRHPVHENFRVEQFKELLLSLSRTKDRGKRRNILTRMGELMYRSHSSYGTCGLGEPVTDAIVEAARKAGPGQGIYGAKITGGGSGGTVCLLAEGKKGLDAARRIAASVVQGGGFLALGSSDGARWG